MSKHFLAAVGALVLAGASPAPAQSLTEPQARAIIAPWYSLFNVASRGDVKSIQEQVLTPDYESCAGYLPGECWGRDTSIKVVGNFSNSIPDMKFDIKEVLVVGDRVIVRGEVTGTLLAEGDYVIAHGRFFGHGRPRSWIAADIVRFEDGKLAEHWDVLQDEATQAESLSGLPMFGDRFPV